MTRTNASGKNGRDRNPGNRGRTGGSENSSRTHGPEEVRLSREMSGFSVTMIGVGAMIGAGIFVLTGIAAGVAGPGLLLAFGLNGIVTLFTAMAYAELGSCFHDAGGGYLWVKSALPHPNGFLSGWMSWFAHAVACSLYALGFGAYFGHVLQGFGVQVPHVPYLPLEKMLAVGACLVFAYINFRGASETGKAGNIVTLSKVLIILVFVAAGAWAMRGMPGWEGSFRPFLPEGIGGIVSAMGLTFIAFQGYEVIAQCSEEVVDPKRNIPRAIFVALLIVIPIYLLVAFVSIGAIRSGATPSWKFLGEMKELAIVAAAKQFFPGGGVVLLIGGLLSTASALLATIYSSSRVAFAMARDHNLPAVLGKVHAAKKTPHAAIAASALIVVLMAVALPIEDVASAADIMFLLVFLQVNVTLIRMRKTHPKLQRGFRVPLVPLVPMVGIATQLFIAVYMFVYSPRAWASAAAWLVVGFAFYKLYASKTEEQALSVLALAEAEAGRKEYRVLVVPFRQDQVKPLMRLAAGFAKNYEGEVTAVSVVESPPNVRLRRYSGDLHEPRALLRLAENLAHDWDITFHRFIKISHRMSYGILETAREEKSNFILVGPLRKETLAGHFREIVLLNVLEHAPCNVGIFRGETVAQVERLLLAVEDTPSCLLAVNVAPALAAELDVPVALLHLVPLETPAPEEQQASEWLEEITKELPFRTPVEKHVLRSADIAKSIIEQTRETDLLLMGASRYAGKITSLFTSEVEERVMEGVSVPILLLKRYQQQKSSRLSGILTGR